MLIPGHYQWLVQQGIIDPAGSDFIDSSQFATNTKVDALGVWQTYSPTFTWGTTATTKVGRYCQIGKTVHFEASATITSIGTPSGVPTFSLPVTYANGFYNGGITNARLLDSGSNVYAAFPAMFATTITVYLIGTGGLISATPTSTTPFTWTTNDAFYVSGTYEAS